VDAHRRLIASLKGLGVKIVLLGGPEDRLRNQQIAHGLQVISSPTDQGLRDGLISMDACDIVISGDSLGMHMGIALKKWVVAWFGPTCAHEIDLYDRGAYVLSTAPCSPCWKRSCNKNPMCYDLVDLNELIQGVKKGIQWLMSSSTPRLSVISSCPSRSYEESSGSGLTSP
jgi:heptosyltransferase-2